MSLKESRQEKKDWIAVAVGEILPSRCAKSEVGRKPKSLLVITYAINLAGFQKTSISFA